MPLDIPYTKKRAAQFRGPSSSDDYNERILENYRDLTVLYNRVRLGEVELGEFYRRVFKEQLSMTDKITELEGRVDSLEKAGKVFNFGSDSVVDNDRFDGQPLFSIEEQDRLTVDPLYGLMVLPRVETSSLSKLLFTDNTGNEVVPPTLETRISPNTSTAETSDSEVDSTSADFAFYRKPGVVWERTVSVDSPHAEGAELTLYIKVPTDLFTTNKSNRVVIHPFPSFGTTIKEVAYTNSVDVTLTDSDNYQKFNDKEYYAGEDPAQGWVVPGAWSGVHEGDDHAINAGPKSFYFEPKVITGLRIKLHQDTYYEEAGKYVYSYGLSFFDLRFDKFLSEGKTILRFDAPSGETISSVDNVSADIWNVSPTKIDPNAPELSHFTWRTIWETAPDSGVYTTEPVANSNRVWIEVSLKDLGETPPALSSLVVEYS